MTNSLPALETRALACIRYFSQRAFCVFSFSVLREAWQQLRAQGMALDTLIFGPRPAKALQ